MKRIISCLLTAVITISAFTFMPVDIQSAYAASDNLALGKPVTASSTLAGFYNENVNDGNLRTNWARGNYAMIGEYIQIDLESTYVMTSVVLHNRLDVKECATYLN